MNLLITMVGVLGILTFLFFAAILLWFYRYRFISFIRNEHTADMDSRSPEGYTDKAFYYPGETITFFLRSDGKQNRLSLRRVTGPYEYEEIYSSYIGHEEQHFSATASEQGCNWKPSLTLTVSDGFKSGYYQALITDEATNKSFAIYLIIGDPKPASIVIVAPVSTWTAYNPWGGKSLYQNTFENKTVYFVSTQRPNTAFEVNHFIDVEANTFNWFSAHYPSVSVIPDYLLENPGVLDRCKLLVLSYHCEYISKAMHETVRSVSARGGSIISMGANQLYWVVRWHSNHTRMECRKDVTFFEHTLAYGGMWKHHFHPQQKYLGGRYNGLGMHTFAPYKLLAKKDHWILEGLSIEPGDLFGISGIDNKPICGAETDKTQGHHSNVEIIARGMNCEDETMGIVYDPGDPRWNGSGGGEMAITYQPNGTAVFNTAAIHSGAGLGVDPVFTGIIENFVARFGPSMKRGRNSTSEGVFEHSTTAKDS